MSADRVGCVPTECTAARSATRALDMSDKAIAARPEVMECYLMTGDSDYLLRVVVRDVPALEHFIVNVLSRVPGVGSIRSSFALRSKPAPCETQVVRDRRLA